MGKKLKWWSMGLEAIDQRRHGWWTIGWCERSKEQFEEETKEDEREGQGVSSALMSSLQAVWCLDERRWLYLLVVKGERVTS